MTLDYSHYFMMHVVLRLSCPNELMLPFDDDDDRPHQRGSKQRRGGDDGGDGGDEGDNGGDSGDGDSGSSKQRE